MKNIVIAISGHPTGRTSEMLRMALGVTLDDGNKLSILLIDDGVYAGQGVDPPEYGYDINKHLETLEMLNVDVVAHAGSLKSRKIALDNYKPRVVEDLETDQLLENSDIMIT